MKKEEVSDNRIDIYKWIKIGQAAILIVLGALFIITALLNKDTTNSIGNMLSISLGSILAVYSILDIISGYFLYRNPYNQDCIIGAVLLSLSTVLFIKREVISEVLSYFVGIFVIISALIIILHGVDLIIGKGVTKSIPKAVFAFILAGIMIATGIVYLIFYVKEKATIEIYMLLVLGVALVILGIASLSILLIKIKNTKKMMKEKRLQEEQETQKKVNEDHPTNTDVKIIDISELRNKENPSKDGQNIIVVEEDDDKTSQDNEKK